MEIKGKNALITGSAAGIGQATAFALTSFAGTVAMVGFTMDKLNVRLSNLMAFDADLFGNKFWRCFVNAQMSSW